MHKIYKLFLALAISVTTSGGLLAQEWEEGEIQDAEVVIEKDKKIELPPAIRIYEKIAPMPLNSLGNPLKFEYKNFNYQPSDLNPRLRVLRIKDPQLKKLYANFVKAGFGNYGSPYFEGYFNNKRNEDYTYGIHLKHFSSARGSVDKENSRSSENFVGAQGKVLYNAVVLSGKVNYDRKRYNFYGYADGSEIFKDTLEQVFKNFYIDGTLESRDIGKDLYFHIKPSFNSLSDNYQAKESQFGVNVKTSFNINDNLGLNLKSDLYLTKLTDETSLERNLFRIKPGFSFEVSGFKIDAGVNVVYENDTTAGGDQMHFYLSGEARYDLTKNLTLYAGIDGDINKQTLRSITNENPFIETQAPIFHTNKTFELYGGLQGSMLKALNIKAGFSIADFKNMHFFMNDSRDTTKFNIIYDPGNTTRLKFFTELGIEKNNIFRGIARVEYNAYSPDNLEEAWHKPTYKVSFLSTYNIYDKILLNADLYTMGGIKALSPRDQGVIDLDAIVDLNFKIDYRYSEQVSTFLTFNNILSKKYERYLNYPSRGFMLMLGITYAFDKL